MYPIIKLLITYKVFDSLKMNQKDFKISVICPSYNRYDSLQQTLKSISIQTFPVHEIIVIDDGSTDTRYNNDIENVRILHLRPSSRELYGKPNISYTLNQGIKISTGNYIARIDDDDMWLPDKLMLQVNGMIEYNCKLSSTDGYYFRQRPYPSNLKEFLHSNFQNVYHRWNADGGFRDYLKKTNPLPQGAKINLWTSEIIKDINYVVHSSTLFEKDLFYEVGEYITDYGKEDWNLWKRMLKYTKLYYVETPCFLYHLK